MSVNHKQMYLLLQQQKSLLESKLNPELNVNRVNEIPEDFNQTGWDTTIEKVEILVQKMKDLRELKGKRLTPQFYRSIYNRALIGSNEIDKMVLTLTTNDDSIDFEAECIKLNAEIYELNKQVSELPIEQIN